MENLYNNFTLSIDRTTMDRARLQNIVIQMVSIFLIGMVRQFLGHTIVMYGLKLPTSLEFIWLWKEVIIAILGAGALYMMRKQPEYKNKIFNNKAIVTIISLIIVSIVISLGNSIFIHHQSIITFFISAKFNYIPLIILACGLLISQFLSPTQNNNILDIAIKTIKYVLIFSLGWYIILHTIPNGLDRIGFAQPKESIEWTANTPPPSLYLTEFYSGYVRNQGPFGGPLSLGFYLVAFWPLFFAKVLYKKKFSDTKVRWVLYIMIVVSTYSRAARGMFFISSLIITLILHKKHAKYIIGGGLSLIILLFAYIKLGGTSQMFLRTWSDKGHLEFFEQGVELIKNNRLRGLGAASVGPGSNHIPHVTEVFNPENQYVQIRIEYGLLGVLGRLSVYISMIRGSIKKTRNTLFGGEAYTQNDIMYMGISISLLSLGVGGMVLHPLIDSSSMYPFMLISGFIIGQHKQKKQLEEITHTQKNIVKPSIDRIKKTTHNNKKTILQGRKIWTIAMGLFFTAQTVIVAEFNIFNNNIIISIIRDLLFGSFLLYTLRTYKSHIISFFNNNKIIISASMLLFIINLIYLVTHINQDMMHIIAGIKYDIYFLVILVPALWLGHILYHTQHGETILKFIQWFGKFIVIILVGGVIRQLLKTIQPNLFINYLGFSSPSDFVPFTKPPIYYITGAGGIQRLSGFFVGPNTLGFFIILFTSLLYSLYKKYIFQKKNRWIIALYLIMIVSILSRGLIIGVMIQAIVLLFCEQYITGQEKNITNIKKNIKKLKRAGIIFIISIGTLIGINQRKESSNTERTGALDTSIQIISQGVSLLGSGPGYIGPARHYEINYIDNQKNNLSMLENIYLQTVLNQGILGLILITIIFIVLGKYHYTLILFLQHTIANNNSTDYNIAVAVQYMGIGLFGLLSIGRFLHIFIDSMVNYLFFIVYGIGIGYLRNTKRFIS